jgi:hypothetical protein
MNASRKIKLGVLAALLVALAAGGGAYAAARHGGSTKAAASGSLSIGSFVSTKAGGSACSGHGPGRGPGGGDDVAAAAAYLGLTQATLQVDLASGKTLGQVADATTGKSKDGLIAALVTHEKTELAQAVTAGKLTQAEADQIQATLTDRFTNLANGTRPPRGHDGPDGHDGHGGAPPASGGTSSFGGTHI